MISACLKRWLQSDHFAKRRGAASFRPFNYRPQLRAFESRVLPSFVVASAFPAGKSPQGCVVGDFNGDGKLDLAVTNGTNDTASILLGNGDGTFKAPITYNVTGTFQTPISYNTGNGPGAVEAADLNGDGNLDLVVAINRDNTVQVWDGNGDGTFSGPTTYAAGAWPNSIAIADLDGDGHPDIAVANNHEDNVWVLHNKGDGTFQSTFAYHADAGASVVQAADFNGDGVPDLVVTDSANNDVSLMLGTGHGNLRAAVDSYANVISPFAIQSADFNHDGQQDLIVTSKPNNGVSILLGNGDDTFQPPIFTSTGGGSAPEAVAVADLNGDGNLDVITADGGTGDIGVLLGKGDGTFQPVVHYALNADPNAIVVGDFTSDGQLDIVTTNNNNTYSVLLGNGDGTFQSAINYQGNGDPGNVITADLSGSGKLDLVMTNYNTGQMSVVLGNGDGTFQNPVNYNAGSNPNGLAVGDLNGDGKPDVVVADYSGDSITVLLGNGDGTFGSPIKTSLPAGREPTSVRVADFNGDGTPDIVVGDYNTGITVADGNGDGTFANATTYAAGPVPYNVTVANLTAYGQPEVVAADYGFGGTSDVTVLSRLLVGVDTLVLTAPAGAKSGVPFDVTLTAYTPSGSVDTGYGGTVHFSSTDLQAMLPPDYTFLSSDSGQHIFTVTLTTDGNETITAADFSYPAVRSSSTVNVSPVADHFLVTPSSTTAVAGTTFSVTVTALDASGQTATGYTGTIHFSTSSTKYVLPANYTFTVADAGTHTFNVQLDKAGNQTITVTDTVVTTLTGQMNTRTEFSTPTAASGPEGITVGPDGNLWFVESSANQIGTSTATGSITEFALPADSQPVSIVRGPEGNLWFTEEGSNKIGRITTTGTLTEFTVPTAGSEPYGIAVGSDGNVWFTELAANKIGRISTSGVFNGEFTLPAGTVPEGITLGPDKNLWFTESGTNEFAKITTAGKVTAYHLAAGSSPAMIVTGSNKHLGFTEPGSNAIGQITTTGIITTYALRTPNSQPWGITSGPDGALWFTELAGNRIGRITTKGAIVEFPVASVSSQPFGIVTGPDQNIWWTESAGSNIGQLVPYVVITPAAAKHLSLTGLSSAVAGSPYTITVTAHDAYHNVATGYRGTIHFTSTDTQASLPLDYTFTAADAGVHQFVDGITFNTTGTQTLKATDTQTSTITGKKAVSVSAPPVASGLGGMPDILAATGLPATTVSDGNPLAFLGGTEFRTNPDADADLAYEPGRPMGSVGAGGEDVLTVRDLDAFFSQLADGTAMNDELLSPTAEMLSEIGWV